MDSRRKPSQYPEFFSAQERRFIKLLKKLINERTPFSYEVNNYLTLNEDPEIHLHISEYEGNQVKHNLILIAIHYVKTEKELSIVLLNWIIKSSTSIRERGLRNEFTFAVAGLQLTTLYCELGVYQCAQNTLSATWEKISQFKCFDLKGNKLHSQLKDIYFIYFAKFHLTSLKPRMEVFRLLAQIHSHDIVLDLNLYTLVVLIKVLACFHDHCLDDALNILDRFHVCKRELNNVKMINNFKLASAPEVRHKQLMRKSKKAKALNSPLANMLHMCENLQIYLSAKNGDLENARKFYTQFKRNIQKTVTLESFLERLEKSKITEKCMKFVLLWRLEDSYIKTLTAPLDS